MENTSLTLEQVNDTEEGRVRLYHMLFNFKGYGNPYGKYWFIGQEENWNGDSKSNIFSVRYNINETTLDTYTKTVSQINYESDFNEPEINTLYSGIPKILSKLGFNSKEQKQIIEEDVFLTNIRFCFEKTNMEIIEKWFGKNIALEFDITMTNYIKELSNYWKNHFQKDRITFFLGASENTQCLNGYYINLFKKFLDVAEVEYEDLWNSKMLDTRFGKIYILYHPSSRGAKFQNRLNEVFSK